MGALSGPLHGGAPSRALALLEAIGTADNARPYLSTTSRAARRSWGSVTASTRPTIRDPRSCAASPNASRPTRSSSPRSWRPTVVEVLAELKPGRDLYANVEFYAGVVMDHCGLPRRAVHPHVRVEPRDRVVRQHPRAGRRQPDHPAVGPLRRPAAAPARARSGLTVTRYDHVEAGLSRCPRNSSAVAGSDRSARVTACHGRCTGKGGTCHSTSAPRSSWPATASRESTEMPRPTSTDSRMAPFEPSVRVGGIDAELVEQLRYGSACPRPGLAEQPGLRAEVAGVEHERDPQRARRARARCRARRAR